MRFFPLNRSFDEMGDFRQTKEIKPQKMRFFLLGRLKTEVNAL